MDTLQVVVIHRHRLFREGLVYALAQQPSVTVLDVAVEAAEVLEKLKILRPDLIIMDFSFQGQHGFEGLKQLHRHFPEVKILVMGLPELESEILACIEAGASGYLPQEASLDDLLCHMQAVVAGEAFCSPKVAGFLFTWIREEARKRERFRLLDLVNLTRRELEILTLLEEGLSNKEIAMRLHIEVQTVKNHVHNVLKKLQIEDRREAARYAREQGLMRRAS
jgi:two-component system, NarL family, nitrate/nitrite response regulator NarL